MLFQRIFDAINYVILKTREFKETIENAIALNNNTQHNSTCDKLN